tara:strand:+ start:7390 stop:8271 length:882 start_codon:yes stop_codon:yes gene_type:complete
MFFIATRIKTVLVISLLLISCSLLEESSTSNISNFNIQDSNGRAIVFDNHPNKMIVYDAAAIEILLAMGEGNRIIGTHQFVQLPANSPSITRVGDAFNVNYEKIVQLNPDLFFVFYDTFSTELEDLGIKVLYLNSLDSDLEDIRAHIKIWGVVTGNKKEAENLVDSFDINLNSIINQVPDSSTKPVVYYHTFDYWTPGGNTLIGSIFELVDTNMVSRNLSGYSQISFEELVSQNPEFIFTDEWGYDQITSENALQSVNAIKNNQVYILKNGSLSVASHNIVLAIEELTNIIYK